MPDKNFTVSLQEKVIALLTVSNSDSCWEWTASKSRGGYGHLRYNNQYYYAHRVMYEAHYGPIPKGMFVCHTCDNPACANPAHLFLGSPKDNMDDRDSKGRQARGERGGLAKLTEAQVVEIRYLRECGWSFTALGEAFGVSLQSAKAVALRKTWKHVP